MKPNRDLESIQMEDGPLPLKQLTEQDIHDFMDKFPEGSLKSLDGFRTTYRVGQLEEERNAFGEQKCFRIRARLEVHGFWYIDEATIAERTKPLCDQPEIAKEFPINPDLGFCNHCKMIHNFRDHATHKLS